MLADIALLAKDLQVVQQRFAPFRPRYDVIDRQLGSLLRPRAAHAARRPVAHQHQRPQSPIGLSRSKAYDDPLCSCLFERPPLPIRPLHKLLQRTAIRSESADICADTKLGRAQLQILARRLLSQLAPQRGQIQEQFFGRDLVAPAGLEPGEKNGPRPGPIVLPDPPIGCRAMLQVVEHGNPLRPDFRRDAADILEDFLSDEPRPLGPKAKARLHGISLAAEGDETLMRQSNRHIQNGRDLTRPATEERERTMSKFGPACQTDFSGIALPPQKRRKLRQDVPNCKSGTLGRIPDASACAVRSAVGD